MLNPKFPVISIIIPTLNEAKNLQMTIDYIHIAAQNKYGQEIPIEIIVVDGKSKDHTIDIAKPIVNNVFITKSGRWSQMNYGAKFATSEILLFLHADTLLPKGSLIYLLSKMKNPKYSGGGFLKDWNYSPLIKLTSFMQLANWWWQGLGKWLVFLFKLFPGDNAFFIRKKLFQKLHGFRKMWICEDFDLSSRLKKLNPNGIICIPYPLKTSARRFELYGFFHVWFMWCTMFILWKIGFSQKFLRDHFKKYNHNFSNLNQTILRF